MLKHRLGKVETRMGGIVACKRIIELGGSERGRINGRDSVIHATIVMDLSHVEGQDLVSVEHVQLDVMG